jgi:hypothetical protein
MGTLDSCSLCGLPVLELDGQFEHLEPYFAPDFTFDAGHPAAKVAGECHSTCLARSEHGQTWSEWRVRHFSTVRGYRLVAEQGGWSVLVLARRQELLAFHVDGSSAAGERPAKHPGSRVVEGGVLVPVEEEWNLAHPDVAVIGELQAHLASEGEYPISRVLDALGIAGLLRWPQALEGAMFMFAGS